MPSRARPLLRNRANRPQTARDLSTMLERVTAPWTAENAEAWWGRFERDRQRSHAPAGAATEATATAAGFELGSLHRSATHRNPEGQPPTETGLDRTTAFAPPPDDVNGK